MLKIKLLREVLVGDADVIPARKGTVVELDRTKAKEFIALGLAEEAKDEPIPGPDAGEKKAPEPQNKMAPAAANKAIAPDLPDDGKAAAPSKK